MIEELIARLVRYGCSDQRARGIIENGTLDIKGNKLLFIPATKDRKDVGGFFHFSFTEYKRRGKAYMYA